MLQSTLFGGSIRYVCLCVTHATPMLQQLDLICLVALILGDEFMLSWLILKVKEKLLNILKVFVRFGESLHI